MRGLVDRRQGAIAAVGGKVGDHHRGVGKGHQRLAGDRAAHCGTAAPRTADAGSRPAASRRRRRAGNVKALDREIEILHPGRKYLAKHAPGFRDAEFRCLWLLLHERPASPPDVVAGAL